VTRLDAFPEPFILRYILHAPGLVPCRALSLKAPMPAILDEWFCMSCGEGHVLCSPDTRPSDLAGVYEFTCPVTGKRTVFFNDRWSRFTVGCPVGTISLHRVNRIHDPVRPAS
jgi:hypothetical protein